MITHPTQLIPAYAKKASEEQKELAKRILLIGRSGHGKSTAACAGVKGPVIIADAENNVPPELHSRNDVYILPLHDQDWVKKTFNGCTNAWLALMRFIDFGGDGRKLTSECTLVIDSLSAFSDILAADLEARKPVGQSGEADGYWYWREWAKNLSDLCGRIKRLQCNVVLTTHEHETIDVETGKVTAVRWWLPGQQYTPRIPQNFTEVYRQIRKLKAPVLAAVAGKPAPVPAAAAPTTVSYEYVWQVNATAQFPAAKTTMKTKELEVPATWASFDTYK